jgi:hypothetical protein
MANIVIPEAVLPGFVQISKLSKKQIEGFITFLKEIPVGTKMKDVNDFLQSSLNIKASKSIVETLISFSELLEPSDVNFEELTNDLTSAFKSLITDEEITAPQVESLKSNLLQIFQNSKNLKLTLKAFKLAHEDDFVYLESRIITDIRLVFNDNLVETKRSALIIHRLHIGFRENKDFSELFLTLNSSDLRELKEDIERALKKEELIKKDYKDVINFINSVN